MGAQNSGVAVLPGSITVDDVDDDASITTVVAMAPVTGARQTFIQSRDELRLPQAGN